MRRFSKISRPARVLGALRTLFARSLGFRPMCYSGCSGATTQVSYAHRKARYKLWPFTHMVVLGDLGLLYTLGGTL